MSYWYLYMVECKDGSLYSGITTDVARRVREHNGMKQGARYTATRRPVVVRFSKRFQNRSAASKAEYALKQCSRTEKLKLIQQKKKTTERA
jgi:putative endonuclease